MIRYSFEYVLHSLDAATRQQVIAETQQALQTRTKAGTVVDLDANKVIRNSEPFAFCQVIEFTSKADGDAIFDAMRTRAIELGAGVSPTLGASYVRLTATDDVAMEITRRRSAAPFWLPDAGSITPLTL